MARSHETPSNKLLTLPNLVTVLGGVLVVKGLFGKKSGLGTIKGAGEVATGMALDFVDGLLARLLPALAKKINPNINTERLGPSKAGNWLDHILDKLKTTTLALELARRTEVPKPMVGIMVSLDAAKALATAALHARHLGDKEDFDTAATDSGRYGNALMLGGMGLEFLAGRLKESGHQGTIEQILRGVGRTAFGIGTALTVKATKTYFERLKSDSVEPTTQ